MPGRDFSVRAGGRSFDFIQPDGQEFLKRVAHGHFISSQLGPLEPHIPIGDLLSGKDTPETRLFTLLELTSDDLENIIRKHDQGTQKLIDAGKLLTEKLKKVWKQDDFLKLTLFT